MILNNFKAILNNYVCGSSATVRTTNNQSYTVRDAFGGSAAPVQMFKTVKNTNTYETSMGSSSDSGNYGVVVGSGSTPATPNDYILESIITSGITSLSTALNRVNNNLVFTKTIMNSSSENISISEVGLWGRKNCTTSSSYYGFDILLYREVLDQPITLKPNEKYTFSITISFE